MIDSNKIAKYIVNNPIKCMTGPLLICLLVIPFLFRITSDFNPKIWFRTSDPVLKDLEKLERIFGNDERIIMAIHSKSEMFTGRNLKILSELTDRVYQVPHIVRVHSLTNYPYTKASNDELVTNYFVDPEKSYTDEEALELKKIALNDSIIKGQFITPKADTVVISAYLAPQIDNQKPDYDAINAAVEKIEQDYKQYSDISFHHIGSAIINSSYQKVAFSDTKFITPIILIAVFIFLFFSFATIEGIVLPGVLIVTSILFTFGICGILDYKFDNLSSALPGILIAIGIADAVHLITVFYSRLNQGDSKKEATIYSIDKNFIPTFLTSFSTMIGFLSLTTTELIPVKHLGLLAGAGTIWAWVLTIFFIGPLLILLPHKRIGIGRRFSFPSFPVEKYLTFISKFSTQIIVGIIILTGCSLYLGLQNEVNTDPVKHFTKGLRLRKDFDFLASKFKGLGGPEIIVDSGKAEGVKDPAFLAKIDKLIKKISKFEEVNRVTSILDVIKKINKALHDDNDEYFIIPKTQQTVAENLFLYTLGLPPGQELNYLLSIDNRYTRLSIFWTIFDAKGSLEKIDLIEKYAKELNLKITVTGKLTLYHRMNSYIVETFVKSISMALFLISILLLLVLKSWKLGLLSLLPNVIPIIFGTAIMTLAKMNIDLGTSLVISVCLGIAVDDTIHFLSHYQKLAAQGLSIRDALLRVLKETGPSLVLTTLILVVSFGFFSFGQFLPNVQFGILCSIILSMALSKAWNQRKCSR
jgi:hypothetical protein